MQSSFKAEGDKAGLDTGHGHVLAVALPHSIACAPLFHQSGSCDASERPCNTYDSSMC